MLKTLLEVVELFKAHEIDYCLIGGLAMMLHNGRANTVDIDFYVLVNDLKTLSNLFLQQGFEVKSAGKFQLKAKVKQVPIDLLLADHYVGADVVYRAVEKPLAGTYVRVATPEDLIILKTLADRSIDRRDIEELRELFAEQLNEKYIERKLKKLRKQFNE